jgi:lipid-A-disaccharide synthase
MDKEVVTELIQDNLNTSTLKIELQKLLNTNHRDLVLENYNALEKKLGGSGASEKTAKLIVKNLK